MNDIELLLLALHYHDNYINGRKRLQKIICILKEKYGIPFSYSFKSYYYGPYSDSLSNTIDTLVSNGIIDEEIEVIDEEEEIYQYGYCLNEIEIIYNLIGKDVETANKIESAINELKEQSTNNLVQLSKKVSNLHSTR